MSISQIFSEEQFWLFEDLASRIENGARPTDDYWKRFNLTAAAKSNIEGDCNFNGVRGRLMVSLAEYDSAISTGDAAEVTARHKLAVEAVKHNIRCAPLDGNAWFRSALLEVSAHGLTDLAYRLFQISDRYAPAEGALMQLRIPIYASYVSAGHSEYQVQLNRDIAVYTKFGLDPNHVIIWCGAWPDLLCPSVRKEIRYITVRQRDLYYAVANNLGIDLGQPKKDTIIVDPFSGRPTKRIEPAQ